MSKIIFATTNQNKVQEVRDIIHMQDLSIFDITGIETDAFPPEETGKTYAENSEIKFLYYEKRTQIHGDDILFAEDSGLEIPCLQSSILGINSARFMNAFQTTQECFSAIKDMIIQSGKHLNNISARFVCDICRRIDGEILHFNGNVDGTISFEDITRDGFGYDPIFIPIGLDKTFAMMESKEKNAISHRAVALGKFMKYVLLRYDKH